MRFHIGFSKRIKVKTLIEILGFIFVGLCAYFGLTQHAYAWTLVNTNNSISMTTIRDYFYSIDTVGLNSSEERVVSSISGASCYSLNSDSSNRYSKYWIYNNCNDTLINNNNYLKEFYQGATMDLGTANQRGVTLYTSYNVLNNNYCTNDSSNKSVNIKGSFMYVSNNSMIQNLSFFNKNVETMFSSSIFGRNINNESLIYGTPCTTTLESTNSTYYAYYYSFTCNNVKVSSDIDYYDIHISNNYTDLSDVFVTSGNKRASGSLLFNIINSSTSYNVPSLQYECSNEEANVLTPPVEPSVLDELADDVKNNWNPDVPGLNTNLFLLHYPSNFQELVSLPIYLVQNILLNGSSCTPYELDFSSLTTLSNDSQEVKVSIPCMRTKLSQLLGNFYNIFDILMASLVFYYISLHIITLVDAVTSGEDLWSFYFTSTKEGRKFFLGGDDK